MTPTTGTDLRYPIGKYQPAGRDLTLDERRAHILTLSGAPEDLREALRGLSDSQLDTPYRPGGWTVRQLVHHLADSHMNAFMRVKLALTESSPTIKPYDEKSWAETAENRLPVEVSQILIDALHRRWVSILDALKPEDWKRAFVHPEHGRAMTIEEATALYSWHSRHRVAHIVGLRTREKW